VNLDVRWAALESLPGGLFGFVKTTEVPKRNDPPSQGVRMTRVDGERAFEASKRFLVLVEIVVQPAARDVNVGVVLPTIDGLLGGLPSLVEAPRVSEEMDTAAERQEWRESMAKARSAYAIASSCSSSSAYSQPMEISRSGSSFRRSTASRRLFGFVKTTEVPKRKRSAIAGRSMTRVDGERAFEASKRFLVLVEIVVQPAARDVNVRVVLPTVDGLPGGLFGFVETTKVLERNDPPSQGVRMTRVDGERAFEASKRFLVLVEIVVQPAD